MLTLIALDLAEADLLHHYRANLRTTPQEHSVNPEELSMITLWRQFVALFPRGPTGPSGTDPAGHIAPPIPLPPAFAAAFSALNRRIDTLSSASTGLDAKLSALQTEVTGLRTDLQAANDRVAAHETVRDQADALQAKAVADLTAQIAVLKATPADTSAAEAAIAASIADIQQARQLAASIEPTPASGTSTTTGGAGGTDTTGGATAGTTTATGTDTTGGATAGTTAPSGTGTAL